MRILHLIQRLSGGGAERQLSLLAPELVRLGHDVAIACAWADDAEAVYGGTGVQLIPLHAASAYDPRQIPRLIAAVRHFRPDVMQSWILQSDVVGGVAAIVRRVPLVVREPTTGAYYRGNWRAALRLRVAAHAVRAVVANSNGGADYWREHLPEIERVVIPNGVDVDAIERAEPLAGAARPRLVFLGRFETMKNIDTFIGGSALLKDRYDFELDVCGDGPARASLEQYAAARGLDGRARFPGSVSNGASYLKSAAAFVSLSDFEGRPNAVMEAMAAGAPLIVSDIAAHREFLDESCAILVPPRDEAAVAGALAAVLDDPAGAATRAAEARRRVAGFSVRAMTSSFEALYRAIVARGD